MDEMKIYRRRPSMKKIAFCAIVSSFLVLATAANARSAYDGSWNLVFVTRSGACDATYNFTVDISNGIVTHPNLVKFRGYVARSGAVRASVTVQDKYASGAGRLSGTTGPGRWSGRSGKALCAGYWTAQRN
jgi:hypothetical protein